MRIWSADINAYFSLQIFGNWFRNHFPSGNVAKSKAKTSSKHHAMPITDAGPLSKLLGSGKKRPHRRSAFAVYQERYFATRVSAEYERRWALELSEYKSSTPQERLDKKMPKPVSVRTMTQTCSEFWRNESKAFKDDVQKQADAWYEKAVALWELGLTTPKTPLDYHR